MNMKIKTFIADAFTNEAFKGNPAGVCLPEQEPGDALMLSIAKELGLSETAFIRQSGESGCYAIRFFSPKMEIPLCGHATMASAAVLFTSLPELEEIVFITAKGFRLTVLKNGGEIVMQFPVYDTAPVSAPAALLRALGLQQVMNSVYNKETNILLLEIARSLELEKLKPDFTALVKSHGSINGVLVTAPSQRPGFDFESRYFWPWSGTDEDPVTGGTHTFLAKYWSKKTGKTKMKSFQCSQRTGFMEVELKSDKQMIIKGSARIVLEGLLTV